jgi:hypothetical protein
MNKNCIKFRSNVFEPWGFDVFRVSMSQAAGNLCFVIAATYFQCVENLSSLSCSSYVS